MVAEVVTLATLATLATLVVSRPTMVAVIVGTSSNIMTETMIPNIKTTISIFQDCLLRLIAHLVSCCFSHHGGGGTSSGNNNDNNSNSNYGRSTAPNNVVMIRALNQSATDSEISTILKSLAFNPLYIRLIRDKESGTEAHRR